MAPNDLKQFWRTQTEIGRALGVDQTTVSHWLRKGKIPLGAQVKVNAITGLPIDKPDLGGCAAVSSPVSSAAAFGPDS